VYATASSLIVLVVPRVLVRCFGQFFALLMKNAPGYSGDQAVVVAAFVTLQI
jgi:hypothetical protein